MLGVGLGDSPARPRQQKTPRQTRATPDGARVMRAAGCGLRAAGCGCQGSARYKVREP
mgnify:CR=1